MSNASTPGSELPEIRFPGAPGTTAWLNPPKRRMTATTCYRITPAVGATLLLTAFLLGAVAPSTGAEDLAGERMDFIPPPALRNGSLSPPCCRRLVPPPPRNEPSICCLG
jgi:hypothetical protein